MVGSAVLLFMDKFVDSFIALRNEEVNVIVDEDIPVYLGFEEPGFVVHFVENFECLLVVLELSLTSRRHEGEPVQL